MILSKLKVCIAVAALTLVSYSPLWAQLCDNPQNPDCTGSGGGGGGGGDPQLAAPLVLTLICIGIVTAIVAAKRK